MAILLFTITYAGSILQSFKAYIENDAVKIEWVAQEETNLYQYVIERKSESGNTVDIAKIQPKGSNSYYSYIDRTLLKNDDNQTIYYYCLRIINNDGSFTRTSSIPVNAKLSGMKRTWGSIKAMFR
ncbi:MAG TPA: hypothetical protein PLI27_00030 [Ignavibacteriales bacterium]|nr:hypothetical protein [Ignavibacteriales bacterium]